MVPWFEQVASGGVAMAISFDLSNMYMDFEQCNLIGNSATAPYSVVRALSGGGDTSLAL